MTVSSAPLCVTHQLALFCSRSTVLYVYHTFAQHAMSFFHVVFVAFVIAAIGAAGWFVTPKGKNQT